jgi:Protein of unknown function (DUF2996)
MADPTNHNEAGEVAPSTVDQQAPSVAEDAAPSTSSPETTDIPTANAPDPNAVNAEDNPNAVKPRAATKKETTAGEEAVKPAKAKKEKAPSVEDKPFTEFVQQDYLPALKQGLAKLGVQDIDLTFEKKMIPLKGYEGNESWQIVGKWKTARQPRQFNIYFFDESINGLKGFSCAESSGMPSIMESFLIDERRVTLELLVFGAVQRLNGQKWLTRN